MFPDYGLHYYIHLTTRLPNGTDLFSTLEYAPMVKAGDHGITAGIFDRLIALNPGLAPALYRKQEICHGAWYPPLP
jgi:hypothetical protein